MSDDNFILRDKHGDQIGTIERERYTPSSGGGLGDMIVGIPIVAVISYLVGWLLLALAAQVFHRITEGSAQVGRAFDETSGLAYLVAIVCSIWFANTFFRENKKEVVSDLTGVIFTVLFIVGAIVFLGWLYGSGNKAPPATTAQQTTAPQTVLTTPPIQVPSPQGSDIRTFARIEQMATTVIDASGQEKPMEAVTSDESAPTPPVDDTDPASAEAALPTGEAVDTATVEAPAETDAATTPAEETVEMAAVEASAETNEATTVPPETLSTNDLNGTWVGFYKQGRRQVPFRVTLSGDDGQFRGRMSEPNTFGARSASSLRADIVLKVAKSKVRFTKTYDGTGGQRHRVYYAGAIDSDTGAITGKWSLNGRTSGGTFEMRRE